MKTVKETHEEGRGEFPSPRLFWKSVTSCPPGEPQGEQWDGIPILQKRMLRNREVLKPVMRGGLDRS